ncbi:MAG TPA: LysR family transcriptional regulator [Acidobacteriaceae bacterium]|nr:LysR family transcriptional regulator [Acidobacteriaceae bacterium]
MEADLNELQYFVRVCEEQSFTKAARRLHIPKSRVSRGLQRLEQRLGIRLLERTTRRVALTEVGQIYLHHCRRVMEEAEQAEAAVGALQAVPRGRLRVGVPVPFARWLLAPILGDFLARYPELQVDVQLLNGDVFPRDGSLDILVRAGSVGDAGLLVRRLMEVRQGIYASPGYLDRHGRPRTPAALRSLPCVTTRCDMVGGESIGSTTWKLRRGDEVAEVQMEARISVPDPAIHQELTVAGVGLSALSQGMVRTDVEAGRLVRLLPDWELDPVEIYAYYPSRLNSSPKVRIFLDFLKEKIGTTEH